MKTRETVRIAWQLTQIHLKKLIWYGAIPSFFIIVISSVYLGYQYNAFRTSTLFSDEHHSILDSGKILWGIVSQYTGISIALAVLAIIFIAGYFILPPLFRGIMIDSLEKIRQERKIKGAAEVGLRHFFPMFEFALLSASFGVTTLFTESSFILRWWGENAFFMALPILLFIGIVGFVLSFLFTYAEYYIVLEDKRLIPAIKESAILVIANLRSTILIFVLMLLIGVRIILNVILVLLVPMAVVALATYFSVVFFTPIGLTIIGLLMLIILLASAYLLGLFNIFATAVWVMTFGELRMEDKKPVLKKKEEEVPTVVAEVISN